MAEIQPAGAAVNTSGLSIDSAGIGVMLLGG
jgi:hypothetical protein